MRATTWARGAVAVATAALLAWAFPAHAQVASLSIRLITWHVIGLDSNDVTAGPNVFPEGARICNTGGAPATNVVVRFVWDSANALINLEDGDTQSFGTLQPAACLDAYFNVVITRDPAAYDTTRSFHIEASADGVASVSTPQPRELYVERLLSQNRNTVTSVTGPTTVYVGQTVQYTVVADTAPNGYEQLITFLDLTQAIFRVDAIAVTYGTPFATNDTPYADACTWDPDPTSPTYRTCLGAGRAGGGITMVYTVTIIGTGTQTGSGLILDFSGSSYHYNTDYRTGVNQITITSLLPEADLSVTKTHPGDFVVGQQGTFTLTVSNAGPLASGGPVTVTDTLPLGLTFVSGGGGGFTCSAAGQDVSCTDPDGLAVGETTAITLTVAVSAPAFPQVVNTAAVSGPIADPDPSDNTATDVVNVLAPDLVIQKTHSDTFVAGTLGAYTVTVTNTGNAPSGAVTVVDTLPTGMTFVGSSGAGWGCSASLASVTCTHPGPIAPGQSVAVTLTVDVSAAAVPSVVNTVSLSSPGEVDTSDNTASDPTGVEPVGGPVPGPGGALLPVSGVVGLVSHVVTGLLLLSTGSALTTTIARGNRRAARRARQLAMSPDDGFWSRLRGDVWG